MKKAVRIAGAGLLCGGFLMLGTTLAFAQENQKESVSVLDDAFRPRDLEVEAGTTVTWTNDGDTDHTVTSSEDDFDSSGSLDPGDSFSVTFEGEGEFPYYCEFHGSADGEGMAGSITVVAAATQASPDPSPTTAPDEDLPQTGPEIAAFIYLGLALLAGGAVCLRVERSLR